MNPPSTFIPQDVIVEFISRLPAKNVVQLKSVCTSMHELISSTYFVNSKHFVQMKLQSMYFLLFQKEYGFWPLTYQPAHNNDGCRRMLEKDAEDVDMLGSCNGLVLVCNQGNDFFLWNPSTTKSVLISFHPIVFPENCSLVWVFFGLGHDPIAEDYKIFRVVMFNTIKFQNEVHIYSRNLGTWRRVADFPYEFPLGMPGVYVKGCLHWQVSMGTDTYSIAYFDCSSETYGLMRIPSDGSGFLRFYDLGSLDDETLIIYSTVFHSFDHLKLWILTEYENDNSWLRVNFTPGGPGVDNPCFMTSIQPLYILKLGNRIIFFRIDPLGTFIKYDLISGVFEIIFAPSMEVRDFCSVYRVVESLVSPFVNQYQTFYLHMYFV